MKAFLIAPDHACGCSVVSEVDVRAAPEGGADLQHVYQLLDCSLIEIVEPGMASPLAGHLLVVDEEGLLKPHAGYLFMPRLYPTPIAWRTSSRLAIAPDSVRSRSSWLYPTPIAGKLLVFGQGSGQEERDRTLSGAIASLDDVRQAIGRCYCSPQFARVALRLHEDFMRRRFPDAIVIAVSEHIRTV
jgi:hypothetical protein